MRCRLSSLSGFPALDVSWLVSSCQSAYEHPEVRKASFHVGMLQSRHHEIDDEK